ncbi:hypothetical protein KAI19_00600 [bacterium]|nr:hypothetical protein [bacterium]
MENHYMEDNWLSVKHIEQQELATQIKTEDFFGKGKAGFCDYALDGIDLIIHGLYLRDNDEFIDKDKVKYNGFKHALRTFSYYHFYRIIYTFKAAYNLLLQGYCTESAYLMRHIVETFVRLRYIAKEETIDLVDLAFAGHRGIKGKKFKIRYKEQFNDIAPGLYHYYQLLCDIAHGSIASHMLKSDILGEKTKLDTGIVFRATESSFVLNQYSIYLLAHIEFMIWVFPEIRKKMSEEYAEKYHETLTSLWRLMKEISERDGNKKWYDAVQHLVRI